MDYLNHHSREKEKLERLQLVALKFKMFRELAKVKEKQALKDLKKIKPKSLGEDIIFSIASIACTYLQGFIQFGRGEGGRGNREISPPLPALLNQRITQYTESIATQYITGPA